MSQQTGVNFALADGVGERRVTAYFQDAPLKEVLAIVLETKDLVCRPASGGAYLVGGR